MESLTKLVSIGFLLYQRLFEFCKKGNSQNDPLQSNTLKSVPTLSQKTFFPVLCVNQGMGRPCSPRELVVSTFPFFKSVLLLLLLLLLHRTPNDVSGRFETTGAFPSMFFTCPNFFSKIFSSFATRKSLTSTEFFNQNFIEFLVYFFTRAEIWLHSTSSRRKNSKTR